MDPFKVNFTLEREKNPVIENWINYLGSNRLTFCKRNGYGQMTVRILYVCSFRKRTLPFSNWIKFYVNFKMTCLYKLAYILELNVYCVTVCLQHLQFYKWEFRIVMQTPFLAKLALALCSDISNPQMVSSFVVHGIQGIVDLSSRSLSFLFSHGQRNYRNAFPSSKKKPEKTVADAETKPRTISYT